MSPSSERPLPAEAHNDLELRRRCGEASDARDQGYSYTRLQHHDETRLLIIQPGKRESDVRCALHHMRFSEAPRYEALSYTWGSKEKPRRIDCTGDGRSLAVTENCFNAIRRLRRTDRPRTVWIDAVCIDQENDPERGHQVSIMPSIYKGATQVLVYLGEAADESDRAMDYIHLDKWQDDWSKAIPPPFVRKLLERAWFSRTWVLQEVYMAKSVTVLCGEKSLPWEPYFRQLKDWPSRNALVQVPQILNMRTERWNRNGISRNLLDLLARAGHCYCEDPRDRIYALLSMSSEDSRMGINVDYTISVEELYSIVAVHMLEYLGLDEVLCAAEFGENRSWVPDWRIPQDYVPMTRIADEEKHDAYGSTQMTFTGPQSQATTTLRTLRKKVARIFRREDLRISGKSRRSRSLPSNGYPCSADRPLFTITTDRSLCIRGRCIATIDHLEESFVPAERGWNGDYVEEWVARFYTYFSDDEMERIMRIAPLSESMLPSSQADKKNSYESIVSLVHAL